MKEINIEERDLCIEVINEAMDRAMIKYTQEIGNHKVKASYEEIYRKEVDKVLSEPYYKSMQSREDTASLDSTSSPNPNNPNDKESLGLSVTGSPITTSGTLTLKVPEPESSIIIGPSSVRGDTLIMGDVIEYLTKYSINNDGTIQIKEIRDEDGNILFKESTDEPRNKVILYPLDVKELTKEDKNKYRERIDSMDGKELREELKKIGLLDLCWDPDEEKSFKNIFTKWVKKVLTYPLHMFNVKF